MVELGYGEIFVLILMSISFIVFAYSMGKIIKDLFKNNGHGP